MSAAHIWSVRTRLHEHFRFQITKIDQLCKFNLQIELKQSLLFFVYESLKMHTSDLSLIKNFQCTHRKPKNRK